MCGICGVIGVHGVEGDVPAIVRSMSAAIAHRGPDGEGHWDTPHGTLGHRRLAIIDVAGGAQPMLAEARQLGVVFNGEIYNFAELRARLAGLGHEFRTRSDTEVLLRGYQQWQDDVVLHLRGMFAFAIWDADRHRLFLARDRLGIKPLYYWHDPEAGRLCFASEIKALFADPAVPLAVNEARLGEYLLFRYVAGEETLFAGVRQLEPGCTAVLDGRGLRLRRYWEPREGAAAPGRTTAVAEGRERFRDAVESHLVSDVGLGTITSGGLDSSLVSAYAAAATPGAIDTFCLGFEDPALDERGHARQVAASIRSRHHDTVLTAAHFADRLDHLTWQHDEPLSHPNAIAMHQVFALARHEAGIPVLLSGEGADEVFGGYGWYRAAARLQRAHRWLGHAGAARAVRWLRPGAAGTLDPDYLLLANALGRSAGLLDLPAVRAAVARRRDRYGTVLTGGAAGLFRYDQLTYLQPLLQRQDRMSMAVGLEARVPFLDHPLVEWANDLAPRVKIGSGQPKRLLRYIAEGTLPHEIIYRSKVGFALPISEWLRGPLSERVAALADPGSLATELLPPALLAALLARPGSAAPGDPALLWTVLALETWRQQFFGSARKSRPVALARTQ